MLKQENLDAVLAEYVGRFEAALHAGVFYGINIETVAHDARVRTPEAKSRTRLYLQSYVPKDWMTFYAFELGS